ncbi:G2/mitotic-specific cyclin [Gryganskiella cystojenkinii]|nr:G2/mitotic-specific cyclin [Gryganskiella cystojenkinii]
MLLQIISASFIVFSFYAIFAAPPTYPVRYSTHPGLPVPVFVMIGLLSAMACISTVLLRVAAVTGEDTNADKMDPFFGMHGKDFPEKTDDLSTLQTTTVEKVISAIYCVFSICAIFCSPPSSVDCPTYGPLSVFVFLMIVFVLAVAWVSIAFERVAAATLKYSRAVEFAPFIDTNTIDSFAVFLRDTFIRMKDGLAGHHYNKHQRTSRGDLQIQSHIPKRHVRTIPGRFYALGSDGEEAPRQYDLEMERRKHQANRNTHNTSYTLNVAPSYAAGPSQAYASARYPLFNEFKTLPNLYPTLNCDHNTRLYQDAMQWYSPSDTSSKHYSSQESTVTQGSFLGSTPMVAKVNVASTAAPKHPPLFARATTAVAAIGVSSTLFGPKDDADTTNRNTAIMINGNAAHVRGKDCESMPDAHYLDDQKELDWKMRRVLVDWISEVHHAFHLQPETLFLAVNLVDRFLSLRSVARANLQMFGAAALFIASKYEDKMEHSIHNFVYMADGAFQDFELMAAERFMLQALDHQISYPNPMDFMRRFSQGYGCDIHSGTVAKYLMEVSLMYPAFIECPPSMLAAAAMCLVRRMIGRPEWDKELELYSGYTMDELKPWMERIVAAVKQSRSRGFIYRKYSTKLFMQAAVFVSEWIANLEQRS